MHLCTGLIRLCTISLFLVVGACVPPPDTVEQEPENREQVPGPALAQSAEDVQTIQLFRGNDERAMPVLPLGSGEQLTLLFDKMQSTGQPLSIFFYQHNARWERTVNANDYMDSFASDNLLDYQRSQGTGVDYVHYRYAFPNDQIGFRIGGNYVLRVTEQGNESAVLFEKAFYVTEQRGQAAIDIESAIMRGLQSPARRPVIHFHPGQGQTENIQNYHACVLRDGSQEDLRCTRRARVASHPSLRFEIDREDAFLPTSPVYQLDLSRLQTGGQIDAVDRQARPSEIRLRPDYLQFRRDVLRQPLYGQSIIAGAIPFLNNPAIQAEYVSVRFALASVSPDTRARLRGSFNSPSENGLSLSWSGERNQLEAEVTVKQGWHEYRYERTYDPQTRPGAEERDRGESHRYTALVYVRDIRLNTDRIIAVASVVR